MNPAEARTREHRSVAWAIVCLFVLAVPSGVLLQRHGEADGRATRIEATTGCVHHLGGTTGTDRDSGSAIRSTGPVALWIPSQRPHALPQPRAPGQV